MSMHTKRRGGEKSANNWTKQAMWILGRDAFVKAGNKMTVHKTKESNEGRTKLVCFDIGSVCDMVLFCVLGSLFLTVASQLCFRFYYYRYVGLSITTQDYQSIRMGTIFNELGHAGSWDRTRGWCVQKWPAPVETIVSTVLVVGMIQFRADRISLGRWVAGRLNKFVQQCLKKGGSHVTHTHTHTLHATTQPLNSTHIEFADNTLRHPFSISPKRSSAPWTVCMAGGQRTSRSVQGLSLETPCRRSEQTKQWRTRTQARQLPARENARTPAAQEAGCGISRAAFSCRPPGPGARCWWGPAGRVSAPPCCRWDPAARHRPPRAACPWSPWCRCACPRSAAAARASPPTDPASPAHSGTAVGVSVSYLWCGPRKSVGTMDRYTHI